MGMFVPEDKFYDETKRQTGLNRYKQLLGRHFGDWLKLNALTILGLLPLAAGIGLAIGTSSILVLLPCAAAGGMIFGPFLSGMYDSLLRAMRDDPMPWWQNYQKSWKQNFRGSLVPGALLGLMVGIFCFMGMMLWWAQTAPSLGTILLFLFSSLLTMVIAQLYWSQLVLFQQSPVIRLRNALLFCIQNFWRVMGVGLLQLAYWGIYILFAPWTLLILPIVGIWYILFLSQFLLYDRLNEAFQIEEQFHQAGM
ncbi:MAG: hypothetical protein ACI3XG_05935 [Faecousia sp.]